MSWYAALVFVHVTAMTAFLAAHGLSIGVSLRLRTERDPERVRALLDLSRWSLGRPTGIMVLVAFAAGIAAAFAGEWWDRGWVWASLALFVALFLVMYPLASQPMHRIRQAAGTAAGPPFGFGSNADPNTADEDALRHQLEAYDPRLAAGVFTGAVALIIWLMVTKPF